MLSTLFQQPKKQKRSLDLNTMDLTIYGVDNVFVSNVRDVIAFLEISK